MAIFKYFIKMGKDSPASICTIKKMEKALCNMKMALFFRDFSKKTRLMDTENW
jgi:hypothetical protein